MKVVCSYCNRFLRDKEPLDDARVSHGVCSPCLEHFLLQLEDLPLNGYVEGFDFPVLVVREDWRVVAANRAMEAFLNKSEQAVQGLLGGEAMECAYARLPGGCGRTAHCEACTVRRAVVSTMVTGKPLVEHPAHLITKRGRIELRISTARVDGVVRVTIEKAEPPESIDYEPDNLRMAGR